MQEIKRGEIYMVSELHNNTIGSEQGKSRPVCICQNNKGNKYSPTCTVIPLSSMLKRLNMPTHVLLSNTRCLERLSIALVEQITTISKERLKEYIGVIDLVDLEKVNNAIMIQNGLVEEYNIEVI